MLGPDEIPRVEDLESALERISECVDAEILGRWVARAAKATTEDDIFADD